MKKLKTVIIIPARYKSSRFPGKPLTKILGKPMIQWTAEISAKAIGKENVFIATDNIEIQKIVSEIGYKVIMTSEKCLTGTDRLAEASSKIEADIYVNVQGDEPLINPNDIIKIIDAKRNNPNNVINGYTAIDDNADPDSVNIPKVVFNEDKVLVYMSRKKIPGFKKDKDEPKIYYKQVCIYAFNREELEAFRKFGRKSTLEQSEDIEILRFLDLGRTIRLVEMEDTSLAVDVPEDVVKIEKVMSNVYYK
jgi:3-deoxy-manno-octulosonate cytidylyltransferase (CMP-KDO synthetase)